MFSKSDVDKIRHLIKRWRHVPSFLSVNYTYGTKDHLIRSSITHVTVPQMIREGCAHILPRAYSYVERPEGLSHLFRLPFSKIEARAFYTYALQRLPGVVRSGQPPPVIVEVQTNNTEDSWRPFNMCVRLTHSLTQLFPLILIIFWHHVWLCDQVQGVHGRPGVNTALLSACGAGCSHYHQRRGPGFSQEVHIRTYKGKVTTEITAHIHTVHTPNVIHWWTFILIILEIFSKQMEGGY